MVYRTVRKTGKGQMTDSKKIEFEEYVLMVDVFCACIETKTLPAINSPCHLKAREFVDKSGFKFKRKRTPLPKVKEVKE